jgi:type IV pilus assembly protein PilY1
MTAKILMRQWAGALALAGLVLPVLAQPSDIDIYSRAPSAVEPANVLFVLDASANWNPSVGSTCTYSDGTAPNVKPNARDSRFAIEMCALHNVVDRLPTAADGSALFNVGLILSNTSGGDKGGYPRQAMLPLTATNKAALKATIKSLDINSDKANLSVYALMMHEAYLYFAGKAPRSGHLNNPTDARAFAGGRYVSPAANSCARNYIILIGNGPPANGENGEAESLLRGLGGDATVIEDAAQGNNKANMSDEYARFMRAASVSGRDDAPGIVTHAVAVTNPSDNTAPERAYRAMMRSVASYGGGSYHEAGSADQLTTALLKIFAELQAVDSVFASASLPVSVNTRGTYDNQVFLGVFRPDADGRPRWRGNLKQYAFTLDGAGRLNLSDADGVPAISGTTGFITPGARSHWTAASSFWTAEPMGSPKSSSDSPDGEVVEKGGAAQRLRETYALSQAARQVYTCVACSGTTSLGTSLATRFVATNTAVTASQLGVADAAERALLIDWVRGNNNAGDAPGPTTVPATTVRPGIHGDVLHSRPAVVNYGGSVGVRVFYGANDGQLRAVNGNKSGVGAGQELWSFVPEEHFGKLKRLRDNAPGVKLSTTPAELGFQPRDYMVDGPIGVYQKLNADGTAGTVRLYAAMRRGGRFLYALDVSTPDQPVFLWKRSNASAGMGRLGQTWSEPKPARIKGHDKPVLIFGGGYDATVEDGSGNGTTMGNAVFVLDAETGALLKEFHALAGGGSIGRSVPADVSLVDSDYDGLVDRAYAVDLGGQVYRIDFESTAGNDASDWTIRKLADLSGGTTTGRKFFYGPEVVLTKQFAALLLGSGDREKPLLSATEDHFFQIFDRHTGKGAPTSPVTSFSDLRAMSADPAADGAGCYLPLRQGEKVVNAAASIAGFGYFGTHHPSSAASADSCSADLGVARGYKIPLFCVAGKGKVLIGGGLPPSPVVGIVTITKEDGTSEAVPIDQYDPDGKDSAIEFSRVTPVIDSPRRRRYWFQEVER